MEAAFPWSGVSWTPGQNNCSELTRDSPIAEWLFNTAILGKVLPRDITNSDPGNFCLA